MAYPKILSILKQTVYEFMDDSCPTLAAAIAYYAIFSLPPLLILLIMVGGLAFDPQDFEGQLKEQISALIGPEGTTQVQTVMSNIEQPGTGGVIATVLGIAAILFGATGAFVQLQYALNQAWEVEPDPEKGGVRNFFTKRLLSFGMILALAFLLMVSLVVSTFISAFGNALVQLFPGQVSQALLAAIDLGLSLFVLTVLFGFIFKFLPDAVIRLRDVWVGALATALLFVLGKFLIGLYLGNSDPASAYGAAASLAILLLWVYYSSVILLLGAEFTEAWALNYGTEIRPEPGAVRVIRKRRQIQ